jgi:hypothetical protein
VRLPRGAVGWETEWTRELNVNGHGGAAALGVGALRVAGELLRIYRHSCLGGVTTVHVWARQGGGAVQGYDSDAIGWRPGSARLGPCVLGVWCEGKGSGRRCGDERDPLVMWNAAPGSPRGSRASASGPRGTTARATRGVGAAGAFQSASACEPFSSSPV